MVNVVGANTLIFSDKEVSDVKHIYPLDKCTCHGEYPCVPHRHLLTAVHMERSKLPEMIRSIIESMTIEDFLAVIKERDG